MARRSTVEDVAQVVGRRVRGLREGRGLSQTALARKVKASRAALTRLEGGRVGEYGMTLATLVDLANALGVSVPDLLSPQA